MLHIVKYSPLANAEPMPKKGGLEKRLAEASCFFGKFNLYFMKFTKIS